MKTFTRQLLLSVALACCGALTLTSLAEDTPLSSTSQAAAQPAVTSSTSSVVAPQDSAATSTATAAPSADAEIKAAEQAAAQPPAAPAAPAAEAAPATSTDDSSLRRLDTTATASTAPVAPEEPSAPVAPRRRNGRGGTNERVSMLGNASLAKGETADAVVAVLGDATSEGTVRDSVVAVLGTARATGPVGNSVVAVGGNAYVDSRVGEVVSVGGNVELGPNAEVMRDVTCVGGVVKRDPKAIVHGQIPNVQIAPFNPGDAAWLQAYVHHCVLEARPLAIAPHLGWAWAIALGFLLLYVVLALLFRGGIERTVETLETRPGASILTALLTVVLIPFVFVLLVITVAGIAVVPFLAIGLLCASLFGKATMLAWIGRRVTRPFGDGPLAHPAVAVLIGGIIVLALYLVPVVGLIVKNLLGFIGLGVVVFTLLQAARRNKKPRVVPAAPAPVVPPVSPVAPESAAGFASASDTGVAGGSTAVAEEVAAPPRAVAAPMVPPAALPVAGFWIRLAALALDVILVWVVLAFFCSMFPRSFHLHSFNLLLPSLAIYGAVLWKLRGTTIGGIICGLRVVRVDGRELDWATVIVRALSCFLSLVVVGLGFIWTAIDDEKQSWHDKIAGTTVVFARAGQPLV